MASAQRRLRGARLSRRRRLSAARSERDSARYPPPSGGTPDALMVMQGCRELMIQPGKDDIMIFYSAWAAVKGTV